jgi:Domain of unknown function (DUF6935)
MKKITLFLVFAFIFSGLMNAQVVEIKGMPTTVEEFVELRDKIANTPEGGAAMFVIAVKMYNENPEIGEQCLVIAADRSRLQSGTIYKGFSLSKVDMNSIKRQLGQYPFAPNSYFKGATPENGYKFEFPTQMDFSSNAYSGNKDEGKFKVFVKCYGADSPRPVTLIRNNKGVWKAKEWSSIIMGMRKPVVKIDDDL